MTDFYDRKIAALKKERQTCINRLCRSLESVTAEDYTTTTASNIVSAGMQLMQLHAEIGAYEMARDVSRLK